MRKRLRDKKETERRVGGVREERWKNSERGKTREEERAGEQGSQREGFILFHVPISRLVSSADSRPSLSELPPRSLWLPLQPIPFILAVFCGGWGVLVPKAQGFARIREVKTEICLGSEWGIRGTPHHPAEPAFLSQSVPGRSHCTETALDRS